jgi:ubiquitin-protein ligase
MATQRWHQFDPQRLVLEYIRVKKKYPSFYLVDKEGELSWHGCVASVPTGIEVSPLRVRIDYPSSYPALPPSVDMLGSNISPEEVGHSWHRWPRTGSICYVRPRDWQVSTTCDEVISKVEDWYFNYVAKKAGLIAEMPDIGRAELLSMDQGR